VRIFLTIIFILVCIALTVIVLAQQGKDAGLGAIGGIGDTYWGKNKSRSMEGRLVKFTTLLAVLFIVIAAILNLNF
jgi:preprotein translocase subunit SecG